jgi:protein XRP2
MFGLFKGWSRSSGSSGSTSAGGTKKKGDSLKGAQRPDKKPERKNLDPKDFVFSQKTGEVLVKEAGSIDGEQFNIEECKDCDIFLFDYIATIFIDQCENCRIFVGPVESSIFIRNCKDCNFVIACQQFRSRDCTDCSLALLSTTEPVIETSTGMKFACFDFFYFSLREQIVNAGLKVVNNKWWQIHDFNKKADKPNWTLLPQEDAKSLLRTSQCTSLSLEELEMDRVVPVTLGCRPAPSEECCFVIFLPEQESVVEHFISQTSKTQGWVLSRTRATVLPLDRLKSLFAWAAKEKLEKQCKDKEIVGVEVYGQGIRSQVEDSLSSTVNSKGQKGYRIFPENAQTALAKAFFEVWKEEI